MLSRNQAGFGRIFKQEREEISCNHLQTIIDFPVEDAGILERDPGLAIERVNCAVYGVFFAHLSALLLAGNVVHDARDIVQFAGESWRCTLPVR